MHIKMREEHEKLKRGEVRKKAAIYVSEGINRDELYNLLEKRFKGYHNKNYWPTIQGLIKNAKQMCTCNNDVYEHMCYDTERDTLIRVGNSYGWICSDIVADAVDELMKPLGKQYDVDELPPNIIGKTDLNDKNTYKMVHKVNS